MWQLTGQVDPESPVILSTALDDHRTTERLALDGLVELITLGAGLDPQKMHPKLRTLVKIVTIVEPGKGTSNRSAAGFGIFEANGEPTPVATIERLLCDGDSIDITVSTEGTPLNLGRTTRLYTQRQREALSVRVGGCLWPGCDRPPAFTEAHHTRQWKRDRGTSGAEKSDDPTPSCRRQYFVTGKSLRN